MRAASVHPDVWHVVTGRPAVLRLMGSGVRRPKDRVPGTDAAGVVETVGAAVTRFRPGDEVFAETLRGMQWRNGGAFAEYATAPEYAVALKPSGVSFEEAAAVPTAGLIALHNLPERRVSPGDRVLVNGRPAGSARSRSSSPRRTARTSPASTTPASCARALARRGPGHRLHP